MKISFFFFLASLACAQTLPNPKLTPGVVRTTNTKQVCSTLTTAYRHTSASLKKQVCTEYEVKNCPDAGKMEIDHLIPLELGGADVKENLWVQMAPEFHQKDLLENFLHREVCAGKIKIQDAQNCIRKNWAACAKHVIPN